MRCIVTGFHTLTLVIHTVKMSPLEGIFYGSTKTHHRKMAFECYPAGRSGRRVRKQFATKAKLWLLSVTRWKKPKQSPGW